MGWIVADERRAEVQQQWDQARPELDMGPAEIVGLLKHTTAMLDLLLEPVFEAAALSSAEFDVLVQLRHAKEPTIARRLALSMGRSPAALSKSLAKLEQRDMVKRETKPSDRRAVLVEITPTGAAAIDEIIPRRLTLEGEAIAGLDPDQRAQVLTALRLLSETVETRARRLTT
jgi:DNA-binding MarR family transcriptional regulator